MARKRKKSPADLLFLKTIRDSKINIPADFLSFSSRILEMQRVLERTIDPEEFERKRRKYEREILKRSRVLKERISRFVSFLEENSIKYAKRDVIEALKARNIPIPENLKDGQ